MNIYGIDLTPRAFTVRERCPQSEEAESTGGLPPIPKAGAEDEATGGLPPIVTPPVEDPSTVLDVSRLKGLVGQVYADLQDLGALDEREADEKVDTLV